MSELIVDVPRGRAPRPEMPRRPARVLKCEHCPELRAVGPETVRVVCPACVARGKFLPPRPKLVQAELIGGEA